MAAITLRQMEFFCAAVQHGFISRAAEALQVAQPSVSEQLKKLERAVSATLLVRTNQGLRLTPDGISFHGHATRALAAADAAVAAVQPGPGLAGRVLSVGMFNSAHAHLLTDVITAFRARHPHTRLRITTQNSTEVAAQVRDGALELGLVALPVDVRDLRVSSAAWSSEAVFVAARGTPFTQPRTVRDVAAAQLILPEVRHGDTDPTRRQLAQRAAAAGLPLVPAIEVEHGSTALELAARGVGATVASLPLIHALGFSDRVRWVSLDPPLMETFAFVSHRGAAISPAAGALIRLALERVDALRASDWTGIRVSAMPGTTPDLAGEERACDSA